MKIKSKKSPVVAGVILFISVLLLELICIFGMQEEDEQLEIFFVVNIVLVLPIVICGIFFLKQYLESVKCLKNAKKKYTEDVIIQNVKTRTEYVYKYPFSSKEVYFTDRLIVDNNVIFSYNEIVWMYTQVSGNRIAAVAFALINGKTFYLCNWANNNQIKEIMNLCLIKNQNIILGATNENKLRYKEILKRYKERIRFYNQ